MKKQATYFFLFSLIISTCISSLANFALAHPPKDAERPKGRRGARPREASVAPAPTSPKRVGAPASPPDVLIVNASPVSVSPSPAPKVVPKSAPKSK